MESGFLPSAFHHRGHYLSPAMSLWLLDDDELLAETLLDCWQERLDQLHIQSEGKAHTDRRQGNALRFALRWFPTARAALAELKKASSCIGDQTHSLKQTATLALPLAIFVDGHLKRDSGELRHGEAFIRQLRAWCEESGSERGLEDAPIEDASFNYRPWIIAFSSDPASNQAMLEAGADLAFEKQQYRQALEAALQAPTPDRGLVTTR